jgi:hypothetical protein
LISLRITAKPYTVPEGDAETKSQPWGVALLISSPSVTLPPATVPWTTLYSQVGRVPDVVAAATESMRAAPASAPKSKLGTKTVRERVRVPEVNGQRLLRQHEVPIMDDAHWPPRLVFVFMLERLKPIV